jgi:uncharacterized protein
LSVASTTRSIAWIKDDPPGTEFAEVALTPDRLQATGVAIGSAPMPYRLDYVLETTAGFVTALMHVTAQGQGWKRSLELRRSPSGNWTANAAADGQVELPTAGGDLSALTDAFDCDLGLSPLTNTLPVLRHGLLSARGSVDFVMTWISVPDLGVRMSGQRYTFVRAEGDDYIIRYEALDSDFCAEITFDQHGLVIDYPGIGHRLL